MQVHKIIDSLAMYGDRHLQFGHLESRSRNIRILRPGSNTKLIKRHTGLCEKLS